MRVKVEFYDLLRELTAHHEWRADIPPGTTVAELFSIAKRAFPALAAYPRQPVFTSGLDYVEASHVLHEGETVSILPAPPRL
ncbi:MAG: hypothetical protein WC076_11905 [Terrimicrobiaceae bacterium]|jgi:molybdopterin converting factor small subunit